VPDERPLAPVLPLPTAVVAAVPPPSPAAPPERLVLVGPGGRVPLDRRAVVIGRSRECDLVLVVGSVNSSNSNRLRERAERDGATAYLIDGEQFIQPEWLQGKRRIGVTAGASAPEVLVQGVIARLQALGGGEVRELHGEPEDMVFALPKELRLVLVD